VGYSKVLRCYTEPFLLQFCDRRIVHRSNALLGDSYGKHKQLAMQTICDSAAHGVSHECVDNR